MDGNLNREIQTKKTNMDYKTPVTRTDRVASESEKVCSVPEGGWGWIVVVATLTFNIIYDGCSYSFGILYITFLDYYGDTKSNTAWIGSLFFSVPLLCAPLAAMITQKLGSRNATMLGGFIAYLWDLQSEPSLIQYVC